MKRLMLMICVLLALTFSVACGAPEKAGNTGNDPVGQVENDPGERDPTPTAKPPPGEGSTPGVGEPEGSPAGGGGLNY